MKEASDESDARLERKYLENKNAAKKVVGMRNRSYAKRLKSVVKKASRLARGRPIAVENNTGNLLVVYLEQCFSNLPAPLERLNVYILRYLVLQGISQAGDKKEENIECIEVD